MTTPVPPETITAAAAWAADHGCHNIGSCSATPLEAFLAGAAAERDRCIRLITGKRDEFADHARQARALPKTAETLALKADVLGEALDLLRGEP